MQPNEATQPPPMETKAENDPPTRVEPAQPPTSTENANGGCNGTCNANTNGGALTFIYAVGKILPRFPSLAVEKEFAQASGRGETAGQTDTQAFHSVLTQRQNRYVARQICYVFSIEGLETYLLQPHDPADLDLLLEAIRPTPSPLDVDVVVGVKGPLAPPEMCNGLALPIVIFDQIYSFDRSTLLKGIPKPKVMKAEAWAASTDNLFDRIMQMADNAGATDEHRALNYLAVRYPAIYAKTHECFEANCRLSALEVRPSRLSGARKIVAVILAFTHRQTDVIDKYFVRVDVTEEFPFIVTKLDQFYDR